jgi:hypothetical protein
MPRCTLSPQQYSPEFDVLTGPQYLVSYYERFGFKNKGPSDAQYGGGGWYNMVNLLLSSTSHLSPCK